MNYKKLYYTLFNQITEAIQQIEHQYYELAADTLKKAQQETEELYISEENQEA